MREKLIELLGEADENRIKYLGYKSEVVEYLAAADVFILPSSIEGFPLSLLEAMAMNLVCIASNVGAVSQVINNDISGYVIAPGSKAEIVEQLTKIINNISILRVVGESARGEVESKYSSERLGKNYMNLYKESLK